MIPEKAKSSIEELSREELIGMIYELLGKVHDLEEKLRLNQTPTTSKNSSQPPARDFKAEKKKRKRSRKKGAKPGHEKHERVLVDHPSKVIEVYVDNCQNCHRNLLDQVPVRTIRRQITELPEIEPVVIETRQHEVICPCCGERQQRKLPEGLDVGRYFVPRLEALVTILHHEHHIGFERLIQICSEIFHVPLSEGGAVAIIQRVGQAVQVEAEAIGEQVRQSRIIGSDETSGRVHGQNYWQWVFVGDNCEYHLIVPSRGYDVIETFMRNLQGLMDRQPHLTWAKEMQALFRKAVRLGNRRETMTERGYQ